MDSSEDDDSWDVVGALPVACGAPAWARRGYAEEEIRSPFTVECVQCDAPAWAQQEFLWQTRISGGGNATPLP